MEALGTRMSDREAVNLSGLLSVISQAPSFARLRERIGGANVRLTVGVNDPTKAATVAALVHDQQSPVIVITPRPQGAEALAEELATWLGDQERILLFPERDDLPYERLAPDSDAVRDRLQAVAMAKTGARVIVASALALAQRTLSVGGAQNATQRLKAGQRLEMDAFLARLSAAGYVMEPLVQEAGQASRRGGIIDVFPPASQLPLRIELVGREVESLRLFDPATQRSVRTVDEVTLGPAREAVLSPGAGGGVLSSLDLSACSRGVRQRFEEELSYLREGVGFSGDSFYAPFLADGTLLEHLPPGALALVDEETEIAAAIEEAQGQTDATRLEMEARGEIPGGLPSPLEPWPRLRQALEEMPRLLRLSRWATGEEPNAVRLPFAAAEAYAGQLRRLVTEVLRRDRAGSRTVIVSQQAQRLAELLTDEGAPVSVVSDVSSEPPRLTLVQGSLSGGWRLSEDGLEMTLITDSEVFGFAKQRRTPPRKAVNREAFLAEIANDDYVVHIDHGIARFAGLVRMTIDGHEREYLDLRYAEGDKLFLPADQVDRVSRYLGRPGREPHLTRLGNSDWQRAKQRVRGAVQALAVDLLALYSAREVIAGHGYPPDTPWQAELEASFPYLETADQTAAIAKVKEEMEASRPMDRLVCGDVGYGKTEVAIRAAFKAVMEGRQVAILVPTTVLAQQHYQTFRERLAAFPVSVEVLSRFRTESEQRQVIGELASGALDIVIGTHRLLQKDISFKELGLVIIDEEQRFGVSHKERLKQMRREVDVLTLSATPIPRTLYMALGGIRDMSVMETPPEERLPIKTYVSEFDERLVREAIVRELERGGQIYFVHNRVRNIHSIAEKVREIVPEATVGIGHGQMDERELERAMDEFVRGRTDVLVCTTIIESGLDIPNVNTIIINQADKLGLGQMYQLRGRVGRGAHRAYAYLLYDRKARLTPTARQRLQTIFEATELGAGFQIALRDLEIRGAGSLLGSEQSGFMATVGFDLYCRLLAEAVERLRATTADEPATEIPEVPEVTIELPLSAHLPPSYVPDLNLRLALYQRLSAAAGPQAVSTIGQEMVDRFGEPPPAARNLLYVISLRTLAAQAGVRSILAEDREAIVRLREGLLLPQEAIEPQAPRGVQVGRTLLRVEMGDGWRQRLRWALEQLAAASKVGEAHPKVDGAHGSESLKV